MTSVLTSVSIQNSMNHMRTTLDLPEDLMEEARKLLRFKSKTDTVVHALSELVRRRRIDELRGLLGTGEIRLGINLARSRGRPTRPR